MAVEKVECDGNLWALIVRNGPVAAGVHFFTPDENVLQVGKQLRAKGTVIGAHAHSAIAIKPHQSFLQEVLYIEQGKVKAIFYREDGTPVDERVLVAGDTILLVQGGHGFEILEEAQILEVKMGPYMPESKKNISMKA